MTTTDEKPKAATVTREHLVMAHELIERLNRFPRVLLEQVVGKDPIAKALAEAERRGAERVRVMIRNDLAELREHRERGLYGADYMLDALARSLELAAQAAPTTTGVDHG